MGERSLDATAGNPQSAGDKAGRKRGAARSSGVHDRPWHMARSSGVHDRPWHIHVPKSHFY